MSPESNIIDLPVRRAKSGGTDRRSGPARIIIFPGVRIDRGAPASTGRYSSVRRRPLLTSAHAMDDEER
jgi:hypothetical protein